MLLIQYLRVVVMIKMRLWSKICFTFGLLDSWARKRRCLRSWSSLTCRLSSVLSPFTIDPRSSFLRSWFLSLFGHPTFVCCSHSLPLPLSALTPSTPFSHLSLSLRDSSDSLPWSGKREPASGPLHDRFLNQSRRHQRIEHSSRRFHPANVSFATSHWSVTYAITFFLFISRSGSWLTKIRGPIVCSGELRQNTLSRYLSDLKFRKSLAFVALLVRNILFK